MALTEDPSTLPVPYADQEAVGEGPIIEEQEPESELDQNTPFPDGVEESDISTLGGTLQNLFRQYEGAHADDRERLKKCYREFMFMSDRRTSKLYSNVSFPYTLIRIRAIHARMVDSLLSLDPLIRVSEDPQAQPGEVTQQGLEFTGMQAQALEQIASRQFSLGTPKTDTMACALDAAWSGRCITEPGWSPVGDPTNGFPEREGVCSPRISPALFMADPRCRNIQEAINTFKVIPTTRHFADEMVAAGKWDKKTAEAISGQTNDGWSTQASSLFNALREDRKLHDVAPVGWTDTVEAVLRLDPRKTGTSRFWRVWFLPNTGKVLGMRPSSYKGGEKRPIIVGCMWPVPDSLWGMSITELLYAPSHIQNALMNLWLDNAKMAANVRFLVGKAGQINEAELKQSVPGGIIHGTDVSDNSIRPFQATSVASDLQAFMARLDSDKMEAAAVTPITMGMKSASTAFGTSAIQNEAMANIDIMSQYWKVSFLDPLAQAYVDLIQQYQDNGEAVDLRTPDGGNFRGIATRQQLGGRYIARFSDMVDSGARKGTAQILMTLMNVLVQGGMPPNEIAKLVLKYNDTPADDLKRISAALDQAAAQQQAAMAAQAAAQQAPGAPDGSGPPPSPSGVPGQPFPMDALPPGMDPNASRIQMKPGPGGDYPADLMGGGM